MTQAEIYADVRARLHSPVADRPFKDTELAQWLQQAIDEITVDVGFEKKWTTILGSAYVVALGTAPKYYSLPDDYFMVDPMDGIYKNGIPQFPMSAAEMNLFMEKAAAAASTGTTITVEDYLTDTMSGTINQYSIDFMEPDEITATRSGYLLWFAASPAATDSLRVRYVALPAYFSGAATTSNIMRPFGELLVLGTLKRALQKKVFLGQGSHADIDLAQREYDKMTMKAKNYIEMQSGRRQIKIRNSRIVDGRYNSARYRSTGGTEIE